MAQNTRLGQPNAYPTSDRVLAVLNDKGIEIAGCNMDEGVMHLTIPVDEPEELELDSYQLGFITAFCIQISEKVKSEYADGFHSYPPEDDWAESWCRVPKHYDNGAEVEEQLFDINFGFDSNGSYEGIVEEGFTFWATAYASYVMGDTRHTDGNKFVRII